MRKINRIALFGLVAAIASMAAPRASDAALTVSLVPAPGVDLSDLVVGQQFELDVIYTSDNRAEVVERHYGVPIVSSPSVTQTGALVDNPGLTTTSPDLTAGYDGQHATFTAVSPGTGNIFVDYTYADVSGFIETNELSSYFINTNKLNFTVLGAAVPEPTTAGLLTVGAVGLLAAAAAGGPPPPPPDRPPHDLRRWTARWLTAAGRFFRWDFGRPRPVQARVRGRHKTRIGWPAIRVFGGPHTRAG